MGESWESIRARGVQDVVLLDAERNERLYRMGLAEEESGD
jgi:hypothetical protein